MSFFGMTGCNKNQHIDLPNNVASAIEKAGSNKQEFIDVIKHYQVNPKDSLKLKAAYFLIENMEGMHYFQGELLDDYSNYLKLIRKDEDNGAYIMKSFNNLYGPFSYSQIETKYDIETVKSTEIINNIEMAFRVWNEQPWGKDCSFKNFCEYILPFHIADAPPENNRYLIYLQFNKLLDSVRKRNGSAVDACIALNSKLKSDTWLFTTRVGFLPHFRSSALIKYRTGNCDAMADLATYIMRSVGIPVGNDFVPQWPDSGNGHSWNITLDKNGKAVPFLGTEDSPGERQRPGSKKGKVFRRMSAINPESLAMIKGKNDFIPELFNNPKLLDVTDQYVKCFSVTMPLKNNSQHDFAYLSVFNNVDWIPIDWAKVKNGSITFNKLEGDIVYLPIYYSSDGIAPVKYPFILNKNGTSKELKPEIGIINKKMTLTRVFPDLAGDFWLYELDGGCFQGANNSDFKDADILFTVKGKPDPFFNEKILTSIKKYRYVRYVSAPNQFCDISELEFYDSKNKLKGKIIGSVNALNKKPEIGIEKAMDGDFATFFTSKEPSGSWVGLDLGRPIEIKKIKFASKRIAKPNSFIIPGNKYELLYWDNGWKSIGTQTAKNQVITFSTSFTNALFLLKDITLNVNERIFTYENNRQIWW